MAASVFKTMKSLAPLLVVIAILSSAPAPAQTKMPSIPKPLVGVSMDGGGSADVTFTYEYRMTSFVGGDECVNPCRGGKHLLHDQCDLTCDGPCTKYHTLTRRATFQSEVYVDTPYKPLFTKTVKKAFDKIGASTSDTSANGLTSSITSELAAIVNKIPKIEYKSGHFNKTPCSKVVRGMGSEMYYVYANITPYRFDTRPDGTKAKVAGAAQKAYVGLFEVPIDEYKDYQPEIECKCSIVRETTGGEPPMTETPPPTTGDGETGYKPEAPYSPDFRKAKGGVIGADDMGVFFAPTQALDNYNVKVQVQDMNHFTFSGMNSTNRPVTLWMTPGTILDSWDNHYQSVVVVDQVELSLPAQQFASVTVPMVRANVPFADDVDQSVNGRVMCINMNLKAPEPQVKFTISQPSNPTLGLLANYSSMERFRGPIGQVRTWIVTDKAPLDEVRKHLIPPPNESGYSQALYQVEHFGALDLGQPEFAKLLEPRMLTGPFVLEEGTRWFVDKLETVNPKGLADLLGKNPAAFASLWKPESKDFGWQHAQNIVSSAAQTGDSQVQTAACDFLLNAVPEEFRSKIAGSTALNELAGLLVVGNADTAPKILDVLALYKDKATTFALRNVAQEMPQAVKDRAADMLKQAASW